MIQGHGNSAPSIMLVGDGGNKDDAQNNYALTGSNEIFLQQVIGQSFHLSETYRTLLIKEQIEWKTGDKPYYEDESIKAKLSQYNPYIIDEINTLKPNLIIPLGELGLRFFTNHKNIRKFRGSVLNSVINLGNYKILPTLGNHICNAEFKLRWVVKVDFAKAPRFASDNVKSSEYTTNIWVARTSSALREFLLRSYNPDGLLVFDIETFLGIPTCISFCFNGNESVCIPFMDKSIDIDHRVLMIQQVAKILASPIRKVNQNIKYDWKRLECFGFIVNNVVGDTMLAASLIYPELPKNLGFLTSIYTDIPYFKDEGRQFDPLVHKKEQYYLYNAKDSLATWQINKEQQQEINELGSREVHDNLCKLIPIYKQMEYNGIRVDDEARVKLLTKYYSLHSIICLKINRMAGRQINPASPKQVTTLIYDELGFSKTRHASDSNEKSLQYLLLNEEAKHSPIHGKAILQSIIDARKLHKIIEYLETPAYGDGRWRSEYNLAGTETGRSSAGETTDQAIIVTQNKKGEKKVVIENLGRSFQTIAKHGFFIDGAQYGKELRRIFVPSPGYSFVEIDLSQAEARVDTVLAGNFNLLSVFDSAIGIHRLTGSWAFGCLPEEIKKNTDQYHTAKTLRHAAERNIKEEGLAALLIKDGINSNKREASALLKTIHKFQPEIREVFHRDVEECIRATRMLRAPNGRCRQFLDRIDNHLINEAISQLPQCIVSDQTKFSLIPTLDEFPAARMINEAHDGTLAEIPIGREGEYIEIYQRNVERGIDFRSCSLGRDFVLHIPSEASVSKDSWYDLEDWKG